MALFRPRVQKTQILAANLTKTVDTLIGTEIPENIWVILDVSAMSAAEVLDITGQFYGSSTYRTAVLVTQIDINAAASTQVTVDLSAVGPLQTIKFVAGGIAAAETIDITVISW